MRPYQSSHPHRCWIDIYNVHEHTCKSLIRHSTSVRLLCHSWGCKNWRWRHATCVFFHGLSSATVCLRCKVGICVVSIDVVHELSGRIYWVHWWGMLSAKTNGTKSMSNTLHWVANLKSNPNQLLGVCKFLKACLLGTSTWISSMMYTQCYILDEFLVWTLKNIWWSWRFSGTFSSS